MKLLGIIILFIVIIPDGAAISVTAWIRSKPVISRQFITATVAALGMSISGPGAVAATGPEDIYGSIPPMPEACVSDSNPSTTVVSCRRVGLTSEKRLLGCMANENCFSTSAKSTKYISPWVYAEILTQEQVLEIIKVAAEENGLKVLKETNDGYLLAAERDVPKQAPGSSLFYEFYLKPADHMVLCRAFVDKTIFVYPLQQPVSDQGALQDKLSAIRSKTGWKTVAEVNNFDVQ